MRYWSTAVLLFALGLGLVRVALQGVYRNWVAMPGWLVGLVGLAFLVLAVITLSSSSEAVESPRMTPWALAVMVAVIAVITPSAVSPQQVTIANRSAAVASGAPSSWPPLENTTPELPLNEVVARSATPADQRIQGHRVVVKGTIDREENSLRLGRVTITCCAADARAYFIEVNDPTGQLSHVEEGTWIEAVVQLMPGTGRKKRDYVPRVGLVEAHEIEDAGYSFAGVLNTGYHTPLKEK